MLAYLHEVVQNHTLISEGVIVQNNSWGREVYFLRVAASSNNHHQIGNNTVQNDDRSTAHCLPHRNEANHTMEELWVVLPMDL